MRMSVLTHIHPLDHFVSGVGKLIVRLSLYTRGSVSQPYTCIVLWEKWPLGLPKTAGVVLFKLTMITTPFNHKVFGLLMCLLLSISFLTIKWVLFKCTESKWRAFSMTSLQNMDNLVTVSQWIHWLTPCRVGFAIECFCYGRKDVTKWWWLCSSQKTLNC